MNERYYYAHPVTGWYAEAVISLTPKKLEIIAERENLNFVNLGLVVGCPDFLDCGYKWPGGYTITEIPEKRAKQLIEEIKQKKLKSKNGN
jgi:hypothetical protein